MPVMSDEALNKALKQNEIHPLYLLYGEEVHLLKNSLGILLKKAVDPTFQNFNFQKFDGEGLSLQQLQTAYEALPMMADKKCITVKNWTIDKLGKADFDSFLEMLSPPNLSAVLVLYYTNNSFDPKKNSKFKKIHEIISKQGICCEFGFKSKSALRKAIAARCGKANTPVSSAVCDYFIDRCGSNFSILLHEIDKLIAYADGSEITKEMVDLLSVESIQSTAFDLSDAILQNEYSQAFSILEHLFFLRIEPVMILGALNMSFIDLYRIKSAQNMGLNSDQVIADFHYRSRYRITKLYKKTSQFSVERIRRCIRSLEKADRLLKSSKMENRFILEQMLGEMLTFQ